MVQFPIVDLLSHTEDHVVNWSNKNLARELTSALKTGACYLINHGIAHEKIQTVNERSKEFLVQPCETKEAYRMKTGNVFGWVQSLSEDFGDKHDLYEAFEAACSADYELDWPDDIAPGLRDSYNEFSLEAHRLCMNILGLISVDTGVEDTCAFSSLHEDKASGRNTGFIRVNRYRPIETGEDVKAGRLRFPTHKDYDTLTLIFQDVDGGLECQHSGTGDFEPVPPIPGTVVLIAGYAMERFMAGRIVPTQHRVVVPDAAVQRRERMSVIYFCPPLKESVIQPIDNVHTDKYPPITSQKLLFDGYYRHYSEEDVDTQ